MKSLALNKNFGNKYRNLKHFQLSKTYTYIHIYIYICIILARNKRKITWRKKLEKMSYERFISSSIYYKIMKKLMKMSHLEQTSGQNGENE